MLPKLMSNVLAHRQKCEYPPEQGIETPCFYTFTT